mmetsp:Transcript_22507/g.60892  ORF Transcript_22507/g.60892 Transcript_22507/m.60892 type:complete len:267 (+) Transcript_22507:2001-2801(+)
MGPAVPRTSFWPMSRSRRGTPMPRPESLSHVGLKPVMPQKLAGMRTEPPMSAPIPRGEPRAPMRAPSPPDDPPGARATSQQLPPVPQKEKFSGAIMSWGAVVRTKGIAPARRARDTMSASCDAGWNTRHASPHVESKPAMSCWSLTEMGRPWSGPRTVPRSRSSSQATASATAASNRSSALQHRVWPAAMARPTKHRITYSLVRRPAPISSRSCEAVRDTTSQGDRWTSRPSAQRCTPAQSRPEAAARATEASRSATLRAARSARA